LTKRTPKCLIDLGGTASIDYILKCLQSCGIEESLIIVGYLADSVKKYVASKKYLMNVKFLYNEFYDYHGCEYSMALASDELKSASSAAIVEADLLMPLNYFKTIINSEKPNCVLLRSGEINPERSVVATGKNGLVSHFSYDEAHADVFKYIKDARDIIGESMQVWKFGGEPLDFLINMFEDYRRNIKDGSDKRNGLYSINRTVSRYPLTPLIISGGGWINLNTADDVEKGRNAAWVREF